MNRIVIQASKITRKVAVRMIWNRLSLRACCIPFEKWLQREKCPFKICLPRVVCIFRMWQLCSPMMWQVNAWVRNLQIHIIFQDDIQQLYCLMMVTADSSMSLLKLLQLLQMRRVVRLLKRQKQLDNGYLIVFFSGKLPFLDLKWYLWVLQSLGYQLLESLLCRKVMGSLILEPPSNQSS